jgi:hypothetical protein
MPKSWRLNKDIDTKNSCQSIIIAFLMLWLPNVFCTVQKTLEEYSDEHKSRIVVNTLEGQSAREKQQSGVIKYLRIAERIRGII